nr:MAG TPA: hypothetical protein [Caudoviricetes sp.]
MVAPWCNHIFFGKSNFLSHFLVGLKILLYICGKG